MSPPFTFDFSKINANMGYAFEFPINHEKRDTGNLCPYPIPKVEDIFKRIERACVSVSKEQFVSDLFACGALAISNQVDFTQYDKRENEYLQIIKKYRPTEQKALVDIFSMIFALLSSVVYDNGAFKDYLGELFMRFNFGNSKNGQFFTPYHISECMARMAMDEHSVRAKAEADEIISICDPCCGGGGMLVAALDVLREYNINYARNCILVGADIDIRCVYMTYLQLALAGAPAIVCHQNTLTQELWSVWKTPAFIFQYLRFHKYDIAIPKEKTA